MSDVEHSAGTPSNSGGGFVEYTAYVKPRPFKIEIQLHDTLLYQRGLKMPHPFWNLHSRTIGSIVPLPRYSLFCNFLLLVCKIFYTLFDLGCNCLPSLLFTLRCIYCLALGWMAELIHCFIRCLIAFIRRVICVPQVYHRMTLFYSFDLSYHMCSPSISQDYNITKLL